MVLLEKFRTNFLPGVIHPQRGVIVQLYPYQTTALENVFIHQRTLWNWGRQTGKSSLSGLLLAFLSREIRGDAIVSSFRHERSKEIVRWTRDWCYSHQDPAYMENIEGDAATHLTFKSGFRIIALPRGESARGYNARFRIMDESQLIDDKDLAAFLPTGLATAPKDLFMGTIWGTNSWWWRFIQAAKQLGYALSQITSEDAQQPAGPVLPTELANLKMQLGEAQYNQECLLIAIPDVDSLYPTELIKTCYISPATLPQDPQLYIGFDHAVSGKDESVAHVAAVINGVLTEIESLKRIWLNTLIHSQVQELAQSFPRALFCVDATAEGGKEAVGYFERAHLRVVPVDFASSKERLMITLKNSMQEGRFEFSDDKLRAQFSAYKIKESTIKGRYRYGEKDVPDDRVDAAALCNYAYAANPIDLSKPIFRSKT